METENPQTNSPESPQTAGSADKPELNERVGIVEAILFVTGNAVEKSEICRAMNLTEEELEELARRCTFYGQRTIGAFRVLGYEDILEIYRLANH